MEPDTTESSFLSDDVLRHVLSFLTDASDIARAMAVCSTWKRIASEVQFVATRIPNIPLSYEGKIAAITERLKGFPGLRSAVVSIGQPRRSIDDTLRGCMRYAEVGSSVDKFLFLSAKGGDNEILFDPSDSVQAPSSSASSAHGHPSSFTVQNRSYSGTEAAQSSNASALQQGPSAPEVSQVYLPLKPVAGPTDSSLRVMMPVIVFAIIRGFDDLVQCLPDLAQNLPTLQSLLVVDRMDNVTLSIRKHHFDQLRSCPRALQSLQALKDKISDKSVLSELNPLGSSSCNPATSTTEHPPIAKIGVDETEGLLSCGELPSTETQATISHEHRCLPSPEAHVLDQNSANTPSSTADSCLHPEAANADQDQSQLPKNPRRFLDGDSSTGEATIPARPRLPASDSGVGLEEMDYLETLRLRREARMMELSVSQELDISFWRADEATVGEWRVRDVSACIASNGSLPLNEEEVRFLGKTAFGGTILEATMQVVNRRRGVAFL